MPYTLPERLQNAKPYSYQKDGYKCRLDINESYIQPPQAVREAIAKRIAELPLTEYPESYAEGVRGLLAARYGVDREEIVVSNGSDELISMVIGRFLRPGDVILTTVMDFGGYQACADIYGQTICFIERDADMFWSADQMIAAIAEHRPQMVIFSTPSNPVGRVMPRGEVLRILDAARDCLVLVDEAYMDFAAGESVVNCINQYDNLIILKTLSKAYGLAGIRIGFSFANKTLSRALHAVRDVYNVSSMSQIAAEEVLKCPEHLSSSIADMRRTISRMYEGLSKLAETKSDIIRVYPTDANFLLMRFKDAPTVRAAVSERGYALRLFKDNLVRISAANEENTEELLQLFDEILK